MNTQSPPDMRSDAAIDEQELDVPAVKILSAALRIASERGFARTTLERVAEDSGLPVSSLYWRFESKDALMAAALNLGFERWSNEAHPSWLPTTVLSHPVPDTGLSEVFAIGLPLALTSDVRAERTRAAFMDVRARFTARAAEEFASGVGTDGVRVDAEIAHDLAELWLMVLDGRVFRSAHADVDPRSDVPLPLMLQGIVALARRMTSGSLERSQRVSTNTQVTDPPRRTDLEPLSGRDRILEAAAEVAGEAGYDGATIAAICERAGMPRSSLYWHFRDKDDLLHAVVQERYLAFEARAAAGRVFRLDVPWQIDLLRRLGGAQPTLWEDANFTRAGLILLLENLTPEPSGRRLFRHIQQRSMLVVAGALSATMPVTLTTARPEIITQLAWLVIELLNAVSVHLRTASLTQDPDYLLMLITHLIDAIAASVADEEQITIETLA